MSTPSPGRVPAGARHVPPSLDFKNNSLTSADVRNRSLRAKDCKLGQLPAGPKGDAGPAGIGRWALVNAAGAIDARSGASASPPATRPAPLRPTATATSTRTGRRCRQRHRRGARGGFGPRQVVRGTTVTAFVAVRLGRPAFLALTVSVARVDRLIARRAAAVSLTEMVFAPVRGKL